MPCMHTLASFLMPDKQENSVQRNIALSMASYNIGVVAEKAYVNGVTPYAGKAYMLADGFEQREANGYRTPGRQIQGRRYIANL